MKAKLQCTNNYDLFEMHETNRPLHDDTLLTASMRLHGFMPSGAIHCKPNGNGKLRIVRGHNRFHVGKRMKLQIYYIVDNTECDIGDLEGDSSQTWSSEDFVRARAKGGKKDYVFLLAFKSEHGLTMGAAASLVGGESAGSTNKIKLIKSGNFKCGAMDHANAVVKIIDLCRELRVPFATSTAFVNAVSKILRVSKFDPKVFCDRLRLYPAMMCKRGRVDEYLEEIETLYNHGAKGKRMSVKFEAIEEGKRRQVSFGKDA